MLIYSNDNHRAIYNSQRIELTQSFINKWSEVTPFSYAKEVAAKYCKVENGQKLFKINLVRTDLEEVLCTGKSYGLIYQSYLRIFTALIQTSIFIKSMVINSHEIKQRCVLNETHLLGDTGDFSFIPDLAQQKF